MRVHRMAVPAGLVTTSLFLFAPATGARAAARLVVPTQYATIQAAVDAASPGDAILIRPGTYAEQVTIGKSISIKGSGPQLTTIQAPSTLALDDFGRTSIIKIDSGATVDMTNLAISGPATTACAEGSLNSGIWVLGGATLNLSSARVAHIHDTPRQFCTRSGTALSVGSFLLGEVGHARVDKVIFSDFQANGIGVFEPGSDVTVTHSLIDAQTTAADVGVFTGGVEVGDGAVAKVRYNVIKDARCVGSIPFGPCGGDPMSNFQAAGITSGPALPPGPGTEFAYNVISGNDVGVYLAFADQCCSVHDNWILNNIYFGVVIQDGTNEESRTLIAGGPVGVAVVADAVDSLGVLHGYVIFGQSIAPTQELECCGFNATVQRTP